MCIWWPLSFNDYFIDEGSEVLRVKTISKVTVLVPSRRRTLIQFPFPQTILPLRNRRHRRKGLEKQEAWRKRNYPMVLHIGNKRFNQQWLNVWVLLALRGKLRLCFKIKLTCEQREFELCGSTYNTDYFNSKYYSTAPSPVGRIPRYRTSDEEVLPLTWKATSNLCIDFWLCGGGGSPNPRIVQDSTVYFK